MALVLQVALDAPLTRSFITCRVHVQRLAAKYMADDNHLRLQSLTACKMGPLASKAGSPSLLPSRPKRVFGVGRAFRLPIAGWYWTVRLVLMVRLLNHVTAVWITAVFGRGRGRGRVRVRSRGLTLINVLGHSVCICIRESNIASIEVPPRIHQIYR